MAFRFRAASALCGLSCSSTALTASAAVGTSSSYTTTPCGAPNSQTMLWTSRRFQVAKAPAAKGGAVAGTGQKELTSLLDELDTLTTEAIPIGLCFQGLSRESKKYLNTKKMSLEPFLRKNAQRYKVANQGGIITVANIAFANRKIDTTATEPGDGLGTYNADGSWESLESEAKRLAYMEARNRVMLMQRAQQAAQQAVATKEHEEWLVKEEERKANLRKRKTEKIYEMLKYIPNEWSAWADLGIPAKAKDAMLEDWRPRRWFEQPLMKHYFEVRGDASAQWEVRRAVALQKHMAALEEAAANGEEGPGTFEDDLKRRGRQDD